MQLSTTLLCLVAMGLPAQVPDALAAGLPAAPSSRKLARPLLDLQPQLKADLLPPGKTQGAFHLTGLVRKNGEIVLRWANSEGEMPTEGVRIFRQKVGTSDWKELTGRTPPGFLQGRAAEKRLDRLPAEDRERILAYPFGNITHDPGTRLRIQELPRITPKGAPSRAKDLRMADSLAQFRSLRSQGRLSRSDLKLMQMRADADGAMADLLGLTHTDDPGRGQWRYKIQVILPEGGVAEALCTKVFDTREPTLIPQPEHLTAASGNGEVLLNWDESPSDVVAGYNVYRSENPDGPWHNRINSDPIKRVELELEDPELTLRRSLGIQEAMTRMLRPIPGPARTPQKISEAHQAALTQVEQADLLPALKPAVAAMLKAAVAAGRIRPGGRQAPAAIFTDSTRTAGNALQTERTYHYKVAAIDIGGQEQPLDTAPVVAGIPRDLQAPQVPGQPSLKAEKAALVDLRAAQRTRLAEPRLAAAEQALLGKLPKVAAPMTPAHLPLSPSAAIPAASVLGAGSPATPALVVPGAGSLTLAEARRQHLARLASTMPIAQLQKLALATVFRSNPDGSVPPALLAWDPVPDGDLKGYEVHKAIGSGPFTKVAETTLPEWTDADLAPGQSYRYAIASVDKLGNASARSPEGRLDVSDTSLPGRLAIPQVQGAVAKDLPSLAPVRRLGRPLDRIMASGTLRTTRAALLVPKMDEGLVTEFQAPKASVAPRTAFSPKAAFLPKATSSASPLATPPLAKSLAAPPMAEAGAIKAWAVQPLVKPVVRSLNPMRVFPAPPKELHVSLQWARPLQGFPLEYVVQQAASRVEVVSVKRPVVQFQGAFTGFDYHGGPGKPQAPAGSGQNAPPTVKPAALQSPATPEAMTAGPKGFLASTPLMHATVARGLVATQGAGLRLADVRQDHMASLVAKGGPGPFTRVNEAPVTTERFAVSFPAEVAQYGGASVYFRVQAFTREFGRTVEGPMSTPVEVRLPDVVPPPSPIPGVIDLQDSPSGQVRVALGWTHTPVKDLKGVMVDRQPLSYTLVDGEAQPGSPLGAAERITPLPVLGRAFTDAHPPAGYQRYTLRSIDQTGNLSEAISHLDVLVPGEPVPEPPTEVTFAGSAITWKAGARTAGFTVWRSFTGLEDDWQCISGILPAGATSYPLPAGGTLHLSVVGRSASGMHGTPSVVVIRQP